MVEASLDFEALGAGLATLDRACSNWQDVWEEAWPVVRGVFVDYFAGGHRVHTGAMEQSFITVGAPGNIHVKKPLSCQFGSDIGYALFATAGSANHIIGDPQRFLDKIENLVQAKLDKINFTGADSGSSSTPSSGGRARDSLGRYLPG